MECSDRNKEEALKTLIERDRPYLAIIFCRTKRRVSKLNEALQAAGYDCDELHGDLSQGKREGVMKRFRDAKLQLLVATDVAARGLDVEGITHIFNYDMPLDVDSYIHRIGRTGRAGGKGLAITFASPREQEGLDLIEHGISQRLDRRRYEKDEFGVGEFITVQGGGRHGGRQSGGAEPARTGRGPKTGGRGQARSGGAPRSEGGRGRVKETGSWTTPAEKGNRGNRSDAAGSKRGGYNAGAPRGGGKGGDYSAGASKGSAGKGAGVVRVGGGYGAFAAAARSEASAGGSAAASSAGQRGGKRAGGPSKGGLSTGYSENVVRGADGGAYTGGTPKGGLGSGYGTGGTRGGKGGKGGYGGAKGGASKGGRNSGNSGSSRGGRGSGSGGFKSGGRGTSR